MQVWYRCAFPMRTGKKTPPASCHLQVTVGKDIHKKLQCEDPLEKGVKYLGPLLTVSMVLVCSCTVHLRSPLWEAKLEMQMCPAAGPRDTF